MAMSIKELRVVEKKIWDKKGVEANYIGDDWQKLGFNSFQYAFKMECLLSIHRKSCDLGIFLEGIPNINQFHCSIRNSRGWVSKDITFGHIGDS